MKLTLFNSKKVSGKVPVSPFGDNTFIFETIEVDTIKDIFDAMTSNFILNIPLNIHTKTIRSRKLKTDLKEYQPKKIEYIVIDIDNILSVSDREITVKFFRDNDYKCILGESRNPLNIKGILKVEPCTIEEAKEIVKQIDESIPGRYDISVLYFPFHQAPILKNKVLHYNPHGNPYPKPIVIPKKEVSKPIIEVEYDSELLDMCLEEFSEMGFMPIRETDYGIVFRHPSERKSPGGFVWNPSFPFVMRHWNPSRNVNIFKDIAKRPEYRNYKKKLSKKEVDNILSGLDEQVPKENILKINRRYINIDRKIKSIITSFIEEPTEDFGTLMVKSPMGTGKSEIIKEVLRQASEKGLRVLFVVNRISLADDIANKYENIKHYLGTETEGNRYNIGDNLVVQVDSLHKFSTKYFDICIMDEFSTTLHKSLNIERNRKNSLTKLFSLKKKKLLVMDAIFFEDELRIFSKPHCRYVIDNVYRDKIDVMYYEKKNRFFREIIETGLKEPITISSGSLNFLKILKEIFERHGVSSLIIDSSTPQNVKKALYKTFKSETPSFQVLMYSPTITVGISNENEVTKHFHYDTGQSMDVLSSIQMIKRSRKAKEIHIYLEEKYRGLQTSLDIIQNEMEEFSKYDEDGDIIGLEEPGINLSIIIKTYNTLENRHGYSFLKLLKEQFKEGSFKRIAEDIDDEKEAKLYKSLFNRTLKYVKTKTVKANIEELSILLENKNIEGYERLMERINEKLIDSGYQKEEIESLVNASRVNSKLIDYAIEMKEHERSPFELPVYVSKKGFEALDDLSKRFYRKSKEFNRYDRVV